MRNLCRDTTRDVSLLLMAETSINTAWYHVAAASKVLKIRCPKGRAGSTPALGTTTFPTVFTSSINLALGMISTPKVKMGTDRPLGREVFGHRDIKQPTVRDNIYLTV